MATFDTLAMDLNMKMDIINDLDRFMQRKNFYRRARKAWKARLFVVWVAGTGNSTLIAAMANYLGFDVYDLELTAVRSDSDLRRLLIRTANWSIIMVEDIDCSLSLDSPRTATPKGVEVLLQSRIWGLVFNIFIDLLFFTETQQHHQKG
ncbi:hypothetical protein RJ640_007773 [Escallonia rubra]|uniref:ATPase AAA-type core domain-containing protein n=1 Tax=Escallonia rubra TaxID=112253 RepID=A0AA88RGS6_9ASTE|nr:hypothetical protein RJ640_007773 [Escallonia rubra]